MIKKLRLLATTVAFEALALFCLFLSVVLSLSSEMLLSGGKSLDDARRRSQFQINQK